MYVAGYCNFGLGEAGCGMMWRGCYVRFRLEFDESVVFARRSIVQRSITLNCRRKVLC